MNTTSKWKVAATLLGLCCLALVYRVLDQGITHAYLDASQETSIRHIKLLTGLIGREWIGLQEKQVMLKLKAYAALQPQDSVILKREPDSNTVYLEGIRFEFLAGKLVSVE